MPLNDRAAAFIWQNGRLLDRLLFAHRFQGAPAGPALTALRSYQNPDGGFGHALEPDMRGPDSQPAATEMALQYLAEIGPDDAMLHSIGDYLMTITTLDGGVPKVLPSVRTYPHAWWWEPASPLTADINPTAALAGHLYHLGARHPWLEGATAFCWHAIETAQLERPHDFLAIMNFLEHVPERERAERAFQRMVGQMTAAGAIALETDAPGYVKKPLDWAPTPGHRCRRLFSDAVIDAQLDALVVRQADDGGWSLNWAPISPANEMEQRGRVTLNALLTLQAYGRLSGRDLR